AELGSETDELIAERADRSAIGLDRAGDNVHERGLAGPVGADETDDLPGMDIDGRSVERLDATEGHGDVADDERAVAHRFRGGCGSRASAAQVVEEALPLLLRDAGESRWIGQQGEDDAGPAHRELEADLGAELAEEG